MKRRLRAAVGLLSADQQAHEILTKQYVCEFGIKRIWAVTFVVGWSDTNSGKSLLQLS